MALKSERFEMRLDGEVLQRVDAWGQRQPDAPSRAEAMRRLIETGLGQDPVSTANFSDGEKVLMFMMRDLYKHLKVRGEVQPEFLTDVIVGGHYWAPVWVMQGIFHDSKDDPRDVRFVVDVLDMWSFLEEGHEKLSARDRSRLEKETGTAGKSARFSGFDGNNETRQMGIAQFLVEKMNRFSRFKGRDLDSHAPRVETYQRMLSAFGPIRAHLVGVPLSAGQMIEILQR